MMNWCYYWSLAVMVVSSTGCRAETTTTATTEALVVRSFAGPTMGTRYSVSVVGNDETNLKAIQQKVDQRLAEINRQMSTYDSESELSRFNASYGSDEQRASGWFPVSLDTAVVVAAALEIAQKTGGAFDPTVGPAVDLWGFGPGGRRRKRPADDEIAAALERVGYRRISVRMEPPAIKKDSADVRLDLSAIAKGFAVDKVSELLVELGLKDSMVEIGGEIRTRGAKPEGVAWRIGVETPRPTGRTFDAVVELAGAMASSGDYRNFFEVDGLRYSHTIDPTTARPVTHNLATVTVCRPTCMEADALATALLVMGPAAGYDWCIEHKIAALFQIRDDEVFQKSTPQFQRLLVKPERH